jgi:hypothetical protein
LGIKYKYDYIVKSLDLDFFDYPPVNFDSNPISWERILRENIFQPYLPKNRLVLEHFVTNLKDSVKEDEQNSGSRSPNTPKAEAFPKTFSTASRTAFIKKEQIEKALQDLDKVNSRPVEKKTSRWEKKKKMYTYRALKNYAKLCFQAVRL